MLKPKVVAKSRVSRCPQVRILIADPRVLPSLWHRNADGLSPAEASHQGFLVYLGLHSSSSFRITL